MAGPVIQFSTQIAPNLPPGNLVWSPSSLYLALSMAMLGAEDVTLEELWHLLSLPSDSEITTEVLGVMKGIKQLESDYVFKLHSVNALYADSEYPLKEEYIRKVNSVLSAELKNVNITTAEACIQINQWIKEKTESLIKEIMPEKDDILRRAVLVNAIYMKGLWKTPFKKEYTEKAPFYAADGEIQSDFMNAPEYEDALYAETDLYQSVFIPYKTSSEDTQVEMLIILPKKGKQVTWKDVVFGNSVKALRDSSSAACHQSLFISVPKFKHETDLDMVPILKQAGLEAAFDHPATNFKSMSSELPYIYKVYHKAVITVDEEGVEAAAASAVVMLVNGTSSAPIRFIANRPFMFAVYHVNSDSILFLGNLDKP